MSGKRRKKTTGATSRARPQQQHPIHRSIHPLCDRLPSVIGGAAAEVTVSPSVSSGELLLFLALHVGVMVVLL